MTLQNRPDPRRVGLNIGGGVYGGGVQPFLSNNPGILTVGERKRLAKTRRKQGRGLIVSPAVRGSVVGWNDQRFGSVLAFEPFGRRIGGVAAAAER